MKSTEDGDEIDEMGNRIFRPRALHTCQQEQWSRYLGELTLDRIPGGFFAPKVSF
jgi:hypothetical protein